MKNNKKLTKEQYEHRKAMLAKICRIGFIVSLAFNVLFTALLVFSCASTKKQVDVLEPQKQYRQERESDYYSIDNIGFDLTHINYQNNEVRYNGSFEVALDNAFSMGTIDHWIDPINYFTFNINLNGLPVNNNHVSFSINRGENAYTYTYNGSTGQWVGSGTLVTTTLYLNVNNSVTNDVDVFIPILESLFDKVTYFNYRDLTDNWNPLSYFNPITSFYGYNTAGSYTILKDTLFAINGVYYTDLKVQVEHLSGSTWFINGEYVKYTDEITYSYGYIDLVLASNSQNNKSIVIAKPKQVVHQYTSGLSTYTETALIPEFEFRDFNLARIYQFNFNLEGQGTTPLTSSVGYNNSNALNVESNFNTVDFGDGQFGDVFGLVSNAFSGLTGLLSINILPNISLGILLFLPLVAIIIFAIIKVVKK